MTDRYKEAIQGARDCVERNKDGSVYLSDLLVVIDRQQAEIERLKAGVNVDLENYASEYDSKIKAEAIKEYKEKLKEHAYLDSGITGFQEMVVDLSDVENIADEMVGEDK